MRNLRYEIELKDGVKVKMLFTPHLYSFNGIGGVDFSKKDELNEREVLEMYADLMYCAALNSWVLDDSGNVEDFAYTRGDFHSWMFCEPKAFGKALSFALDALTGKKLRDIVNEQKQKQSKVPESGKKKIHFTLIGRLRKLFS